MFIRAIFSMAISNLIVFLWCGFLFTAVLSQRISNPPKIAIVGGGIGGTSCAYFLRQLFGEKAHVVLFEPNSIGGRLDTINIDGKYYESGGSIIHPKNQYMKHFVDMLGLKPKKPDGGGNFGIYNCEKFVFRESDWNFVTLADFLWHYGFSVFDLWKDVGSMLEDFSRIYKLQEEEFAFTNVYAMLEFMNPSFKNMTQETLSAHLLKKSYSKRLLEEFVQSIMMVNYGQTNNISAFAGFVSLAGADNHLWRVDGGNKQVPQGLLSKSKAIPIIGEVTDIELLPDSTYFLTHTESSTGRVSSQIFQIVIIATPLIKGQKNIQFGHFPKSFEPYEKTYHRTIATFVKGSLNSVAFNSPDVPDMILTYQPHNVFNSIGKCSPVNDDDNQEDEFGVYKIFSNQPLSAKNINFMFKSVDSVKQRDWLAYPHYEPPENLPSFFMYPGLYYVNAIEFAASAMEMSAIGARNVALLAFNLWNNLVDKVDHHKRVYKDEL